MSGMPEIRAEDFDRQAQAWEKWWPLLERASQPVSDELVSRASVGPGARVLDVGTGLGEPALTASRLVDPTGSVLAVDEAPAMIALARKRAAREGVRNVEFQVGDIETMEIEGPFDAILSRWGLMFARDIDALLVRLRRLLLPGGRLAGATWAVPPAVPLIALPLMVAIEEGFLEPGPATGPFALHDPMALERRLARAGYADARVRPMPVIFTFPSVKEYVEQFLDMSSPVIALFDRLDPGRRDELLRAVEKAAKARYGGLDGRLRMTNEAMILSAGAPR